MDSRYIPSYELKRLQQTYESVEDSDASGKLIRDLLQHIEYQHRLIISADPIFHLCEEDKWVPWPIVVCENPHKRRVADIPELPASQLLLQSKELINKLFFKHSIEQVLLYLALEGNTPSYLISDVRVIRDELDAERERKKV